MSDVYALAETIEASLDGNVALVGCGCCATEPYSGAPDDVLDLIIDRGYSRNTILALNIAADLTGITREGAAPA